MPRPGHIWGLPGGLRPQQDVQGRRGGDDAGHDGLDGAVQDSVLLHAFLFEALDYAGNADGTKHQSQAEHSQEPQVLPKLDSGTAQYREWQDEQHGVGTDVADFIGVQPTDPLDTISWIGVNLPVKAQWPTIEEDACDGGDESQGQNKVVPVDYGAFSDDGMDKQFCQIEYRHLQCPVYAHKHSTQENIQFSRQFKLMFSFRRVIMGNHAHFIGDGIGRAVGYHIVATNHANNSEGHGDHDPMIASREFQAPPSPEA